MLIRLNHFLKKAFPFTFSRKEKLFLLLGRGIIIVLFLTLYGPFYLSGVAFPQRFLLCLGYGVITMAGMGLDLYLLPRFFAWFQTRRWTVKRQLLQYAVLVVSNSIWCTYYSYYSQLCPMCALDVQSFLFFFVAVALSTPPIIFIQLLIIYTFHLKKSLSQSPKEVPLASLSEEIKGSSPENKEVFSTKPTHTKFSFSSENGKDIFCIYLDQVVYISSEDNYCTIFYWEASVLKSHLIRSSLKRLEAQLLGTRICRCHRSYLVNLDHVLKADGNAHGYKLFFPGIHTTVPVSKSYSETTLSQLLPVSSSR